MPRYLFQNRDNPADVVSLVFSMKDVPPHVINIGDTDDAPVVCYDRVFSTPYITTQTFLDDPRNKETLKRMDANRKQTEARYAQQWDR